MICFRCGATVPDNAPRCPSCEQDLSPGATLAAVPSATARARDRSSGSAKRPGPRKDKSDITHQLSVEDIFEEFSSEEEEFLQGQQTPTDRPAEQEDTTSNYDVSRGLPEAPQEDSSPVLGIARAEAAARAMPPQPIAAPEPVDQRLQSGPLPLAQQSARARELPRREVTPPPAARAEPTLRPAAAPRPSASRPAAPKPSDPEPVTGPVVELSSPKPLPELAPALEPEPEPVSAPRVASVVKPLPRVATAITAPSRGARSFLAVAIIGVALGLAVASAAVIVLVVKQETGAEQVRRDRAMKRVQERLKEAERLREAGVAPAPVAVTVGPEGCPAGMRRIGAGAAYCIDMYEYPGGRTLPRSNVTWREAKAACQTRGARLCTDKEWDEACRGEGGADYPYGPKFEASKCNVARAGGKPRDIVETGASAACKSAASVYDMSGNVAEWTADGAYRGGSAMSEPDGARCSAKMTPAADASNPYVGFRCCADPRAAGPQSNPAAKPTAVPAPAPAAPQVKE